MIFFLLINVFATYQSIFLYFEICKNGITCDEGRVQTYKDVFVY